MKNIVVTTFTYIIKFPLHPIAVTTYQHSKIPSVFLTPFADRQLSIVEGINHSIL